MYAVVTILYRPDGHTKVLAYGPMETEQQARTQQKKIKQAPRDTGVFYSEITPLVDIAGVNKRFREEINNLVTKVRELEGEPVEGDPVDNESES